MSNLPIKNTDFDVRTLRIDKSAHDKYNLWLMHKMRSFGFKIFLVSILYLTHVHVSMSKLDTSIYA